MLNLEDYYDEIPLALQYFNQGNFEKAIEIYSTILDTTNPDEETVPYLYLQYGNALIKNATQYFTLEIQNIDQGYDLNVRKSIEDDLELAWNILEQSKLSFIILKDDLSLAKSYFLLGEISLLNNEFLLSIQDYLECIELFKKCNAEAEEFYEVYLSLGSAYEFLEDYFKANEYYQECVLIMGSECEELRSKIEENKYKIERCKEGNVDGDMNVNMNVDMNVDMNVGNVDMNVEDEEIKDINCNKKRVN